MGSAGSEPGGRSPELASLPASSDRVASSTAGSEVRCRNSQLAPSRLFYTGMRLELTVGSEHGDRSTGLVASSS